LDDEEKTGVAEGLRHVASDLMGESLMDRGVISRTAVAIRPILPNLNVVQIGGRSIMDRGRAAILPLMEEIVRNQRDHIQVLGVGPGVRGRHVIAISQGLGLPTGAIATLASKSAAQNAYMVSCLLAKHGFVYLEAPFIVQLLPAILASCRGAVFNGIPPYDLWEHPPATGSVPPHGSDVGSYLVGEVFGARSVILLKDVDGLYTADPKTTDRAKLIPQISVEELTAMHLPTLPVEDTLPKLLARARLAKSVRIINGLVPGNLTRALAGEAVGTLVTS
jgi:molybdenum storage protein